MARYMFDVPQGILERVDTVRNMQDIPASRPDTIRYLLDYALNALGCPDDGGAGDAVDSGV